MSARLATPGIPAGGVAESPEYAQYEDDPAPCLPGVGRRSLIDRPFC